LGLLKYEPKPYFFGLGPKLDSVDSTIRWHSAERTLDRLHWETRNSFNKMF